MAAFLETSMGDFTIDFISHPYFDPTIQAQNFLQLIQLEFFNRLPFFSLPLTSTLFQSSSSTAVCLFGCHDSSGSGTQTAAHLLHRIGHPSAIDDSFPTTPPTFPPLNTLSASDHKKYHDYYSKLVVTTDRAIVFAVPHGNKNIGSTYGIYLPSFAKNNLESTEMAEQDAATQNAHPCFPSHLYPYIIGYIVDGLTSIQRIFHFFHQNPNFDPSHNSTGSTTPPQILNSAMYLPSLSPQSHYQFVTLSSEQSAAFLRLLPHRQRERRQVLHNDQMTNSFTYLDTLAAQPDEFGPEPESIQQYLQLTLDDVSKCSIFVANLPDQIENQDIISLFSRFGDIMHCTVIPKSDSNPHSYAFVYMTTERSCDAAIQGLQDCMMNGQLISVTYSHNMQAHHALLVRGTPIPQQRLFPLHTAVPVFAQPKGRATLASAIVAQSAQNIDVSKLQ